MMIWLKCFARTPKIPVNELFRCEISIRECTDILVC